VIICRACGLGARNARSRSIVLVAAAAAKRQTVCKPGSVPPRRTGMAIHLGRSSPNASRDRPERRREDPPGTGFDAVPAAPTWSCSRWGFPCRRHCWRRGALLPHHFTLAAPPKRRLAVCFLWHSPWGRPRRPLTGTVSAWSPDFPLSAYCKQRPSDRLAEDFMSRSGTGVKIAARPRRVHHGDTEGTERAHGRNLRVLRDSAVSCFGRYAAGS
jgi:hypothetical protein